MPASETAGGTLPIPTAHHTINDSVVLDSGSADPCEPIDGIDPEVAARRVAHGGGSAPLFRHLFRRGLRAIDHPAAAPEVRTVGVVAAWRAGLYGARADALRRIAAVPPDADLAAAIAQALALAPSVSITDFALAQIDDPFAAPHRSSPRVIARVGGFRGVGGPWRLPPSRPAALPEPGRMLVYSGDDRWAIDADLFGHVVRPVPADEEPPAVAVSGGGPGPRYRPEVSELSYLVTIVDTGPSRANAGARP